MRLDNVSSRYGVLTRAGPRSRDLLSALADVDCSHQAFRFFRGRELHVGRAAAPLRFKLPRLAATTTRTAVPLPADDDKPVGSRHTAWKVGLGLTIGGPVLMAVGLGVAASAESSYDDDPVVAGAVIGLLGAGALATGIVLLVKFRHRQPPPSKPQALLFEPLIGPGSAGLRVRF